MLIKRLLLIGLLLSAPFAKAAIMIDGTISMLDAHQLEIVQVAFEAQQGDEVTLSLAADNFRSQIMLFNDETVIDSDGDILDTDSSITFTASEAGVHEYMVAISQFSFLAPEALAGYQHSQLRDFDTLDSISEASWQLTIAGATTPIPVPAALPMFVSALLGLGAWRRKQ